MSLGIDSMPFIPVADNGTAGTSPTHGANGTGNRYWSRYSYKTWPSQTTADPIPSAATAMLRFQAYLQFFRDSLPRPFDHLLGEYYYGTTPTIEAWVQCNYNFMQGCNLTSPQAKIINLSNTASVV